MKKLICFIVILISVIFAQTELKSDTTTTPIDSTKVEEGLKTNEDYKVEKENDTWMETWKEIQPSIRDFLSDEDDEEIELNNNKKSQTKKRKTRGYFRAVGGGWDFFHIPLELNEINRQISKIGVGPFDNYMQYYGGGGWVFLGNKYRIGGIGAEGTMKTSNTDNNISKKVEFNMTFGGFLIERVFHPFNRTEIYLSTVFGTTNTTLKIFKKQGNENWDKTWTSFNNNNTENDYYNYQTTFTNKFFSAMPSIGFRYNIVRMFGVGGKVGYYYGIAKKDSWKINGDDIGGVPKMDLSNIFYSINFYFGA